VNNPPKMSSLTRIVVKKSDKKPGYDVTVLGSDARNGAPVQWTDHVLFMRGVEGIIKGIRINSGL
jgi:hypothetical protein